MILQEKTVREITFGAQRVETDGEGFRFFRMPEAQAECFAKLAEGFRMKTAASAGIVFDFYTDSSYLAFDFTVERASSRHWYSFDIDVNGIPLYSFGGRDVADPGESRRVRVELPGGENRVTVWMPALYSARIARPELSDGASVRPVKKNGRLIVYGDSITQGYDALESRNSYVNRVAKALNIEAVNLGIGAAKFDPTEPAPAEGDAVLIAFGTNDWNGRRTEEEFFANMHGFMDKIREYFPEKPVMALLPTWRKDWDRVMPAGTFAQAREKIRRAAAERGFFAVDCLDFVPHSEEMFLDAKLHPNDAGFAHYAAALIPYVKELMKAGTPD